MKRDLISPLDMTKEEIYQLMVLGKNIMDKPNEYAHHCAGKKLAVLFFEPSTRTRLSFEAAMFELGGQVLSVASASASSAAKGESIADTVRVMSGYADIIAMRHFAEGAAAVASKYSFVPIINAGDGGHLHPTQTLTDLFTIYQKKGVLDGLTIALCGDLKYGRTVHSLIRAMMRYENVRFVLIHPKELALPEYLMEEMEQSGCEFESCEQLEDAIGKADVLYMTRVQQERFADAQEYERLKNAYVLDANKMKFAKQDMIVLHPLPRVQEIAQEVDEDERACYFYQTLCGKYIRMALIATMLDHQQKENKEKNTFETTKKCTNSSCVTKIERELAPLAIQTAEKERCFYCEHLLT